MTRLTYLHILNEQIAQMQAEPAWAEALLEDRPFSWLIRGKK